MHGSSPAAWTAVVICLIGFTIGGVALLMGPNWVLFWIGVGLTLGSAVVAKIMSAAGLGAKAH
ncbi:HGxxPAAW family protein [Mumia quercus]|uniref:HGxxPAAW family protein n=1 Tax=Mumia quercus TaxID=2976125 RepID=UPI0021D289C1|nr:HGxxPAAW family protein [Mumia quercus]